MTLERQHAIESVRTSLVRRASPRMHMLGLVVVTGGVGFVASYVLLHAGLRSMALRYPIATAVGYAGFLGLVWVWLRRYRLTARARQERDRNHFDLDVVQLPLDELLSFAPKTVESVEGFGGGGGFAGGGGESDWSATPSVFHAVAPIPSSAGSGGGSGGSWSLDLDEGMIWLIPVAIIAAIVLCVVAYVLYLAPTLFAELLLDAGLAAGLYRKLLRAERRSWLTTAIRSTVVPACFIAALLALAGTIMQGVYPDAVSIGGVVEHLRASRTEHPAP